MIGGFEPPNSGSHLAMSSSSPTAPESTKVMKVDAVSHFVDDAIAIGVVADMPPTLRSWITAPSAATILTMPCDKPAERTRSSSSASVAANASGGTSLRTDVVAVPVAVVVVVTPIVVEEATELDGSRVAGG